MDPAITDALARVIQYRSESVKSENEMLETVRKTRHKITETRVLIAKADDLLDDFRKVWVSQ